MKKHYIFLLLFALVTTAFADLFSQESNTDRDSYTIIYVPESKGVGPLFQSELEGEYIRRFNWNTISTKYFSPSNFDIDRMAEELTSKGVGREIMSFWWQRQSNGRFKLDTIAARGVFNTRIKSILDTIHDPRGIAELQDRGLNLIPNSYIVVLRPTDLISFREHYDNLEREYRKSGSSASVERSMRGFMGHLTAYVFKLKYDDQTVNDFYNMWPLDEDAPSVLAAKAKQYNEYKFELIPVKVYRPQDIKKGLNPIIQSAASINDSKVSDADLLKGWAKTGVNNLFDKIVGRGILSNRVANNNPILADIGARDGLYPEKRYAIYEERETASGEIKKTRIALVRASNRIATGNGAYSKFFRIGGVGFIKEGMLIKEYKDKGIAFQVIHGIPQIPFGNQMDDWGGGAEGNLSLLTAKGNSNFPTGIKLGGNIIYSQDSLRGTGSDPVAGTGIRFVLYLKKDIHFLSVFRLGLYAGIGGDSVSEKTKDANAEKNTISSNFYPVGAEFGVNIGYGLSAFGQGEYIIPSGKVTLNKEEQPSLKWQDLYDNRVGISLRAGLRMSF